MRGARRSPRTPSLGGDPLTFILSPLKGEMGRKRRGFHADLVFGAGVAGPLPKNLSAPSLPSRILPPSSRRRGRSGATCSGGMTGCPERVPANAPVRKEAGYG
jgi:hypothetical protein